MRPRISALIMVAAFSGAARAQPRTAFVHVESDSSVIVVRETPTGWRGVCFESCDTQVPVETRLRVEGDGSPSRPFMLRGIGGEGTTLHVQRPRETAPLGFVLVGLGGASLIATPFLAIAGVLDCGFIFHQPNCSSGFWPVAAVTGIAGAALLGIGIALAAASGATKVDGRGVVPISRISREHFDVRSRIFVSDAPSTFPVFRVSF